MNLYEVSQSLNDVLDRIIENEGELSSEEANLINLLEYELKVKTENTINYIDYLKKLKELVHEKEKEHRKHRENIQKKIEYLTYYVSSILERTGPIETDTFILKKRKPTKIVEIVDESLVPEMFKRKIVEIKVNKKEIKEMLKKGENINGTQLVDSDKKTYSIRRK